MNTAHTLKLPLPLPPKFIILSPDLCSSPDQTPPLRTGSKEQLFHNKTPKKTEVGWRSQILTPVLLLFPPQLHSCSHEDPSRAQKMSSAQLVALPPKEKFPKFLFALQQLDLTQFNSHQQKTHLAATDSISFIFNKPRGITEESEKQQSHF